MWHEIFCFLHQIFDWWFEKSLTAQEKVQKCQHYVTKIVQLVLHALKLKVSALLLLSVFLLVLLSYLMCWWNIWGATVSCAQMENRFFSTGQYCWVFLFQWLGFELYVQALYAVHCWTIERLNKQTDPKNPAWNCFYINQRTGCIFGIT